MPKSQTKVETKQECLDREARERLNNPDMALFDRFIKNLVKQPAPRHKQSARGK